jgi:serine/threonine-protein kinase
MTLGAVVAGTVVERLRPHAPVAPLVRFTAEVADGSALGPQPSLAISPDGRRIAYVAVHELDRQLYVRDVDGFDARALPGTDAAAQPFFSADGEWLGFFANGKLKKVRLTGGPVITVTEAAAPRGGAWTPDGRIIFAPNAVSPLLVVSAEGGTPRALTTLDRQR